MRVVVVDTNVPLVANGKHPDASLSCRKACIDALAACRQQRVAIDDRYLIITEYRKNLAATGQPGLGDAFFKWLWDNHCNEDHCMQVTITPLDGTASDFAEFPRDPALDAFDRSDRKFVAVALASGVNPPILNATDSDWWDAEAALASHGVVVSFLCPERKPGGTQ
jgi:hypothetical protein